MLFKNISQEVIDYQNNDNFPAKIDSIIENIYKEIDNNVYSSNKELMQKSSYVKELLETIRKRFNLNIQIDVNLLPYDFAAIYFYYNIFNKDSEMISNLNLKTFFKRFSNIKEYNDFIKSIEKISKEKTEAIKNIHNKKGFINLKYAKLEGYFKDLKCYLLLDPFVLKNVGITPSEITAILLHEIGHVFNGFEYHYKLEQINLSMFNIIEELNGNRVEEAEYIFKTKLANEEELKNYLETKQTRSDLLNYIVLSYLRNINSQIYNDKYLETVSEAQADEFATRFNRGKDLVSALHKINTISATILPKNMFLRAFIGFIELLFSGLIFATLGFYGFLIGMSIFTILLFNVKLSNINMTYDLPIDRYNRIKNTIVNNLKNLNLDETTTKYLLEQYTFIEEIANIFVNNKFILTTLSEYIFPDAKQAKYYMNLQQKLENNLNNSLFVSSAKLRTFETA